MKHAYESPNVSIIAAVASEFLCQSFAGAQTEGLVEENFEW